MDVTVPARLNNGKKYLCAAKDLEDAKNKYNKWCEENEYVNGSKLSLNDYLDKVVAYDPISGVFTAAVNTSHLNKGQVLGSYNDSGYLVFNPKKVPIRLHRLAFYKIKGVWPKNEIDHKNGIRDDNRWCNLQEVSSSGNSKNCSRTSRNSSGCVGVHWCKNRNRWCAEIGHQRKAIRLGCFEDFFEACCARKSAEIKYNYSNRHGR